MSGLDLTSSSVALTRAVCDIHSESGDETPLADAIEAAVSAYPHLEVIRDGDTIVARTTLGRARRVVIAGHIDTVPINRNLPVEDREIDGEAFLWGRGTVDMKAGVAVQLKLAAELDAPPVDITWMWYDHEEVDSSLNGLGRLARNRPDLFEGDFAILGEPSNGEVEGGCNGTLRAVVRTTGVRAHSARSWIGENAIHKAAPILARLAEYRAREIEVEGLVYREGLNAVSITGGVAGNVIPDACAVEVNYRFAPSAMRRAPSVSCATSSPGSRSRSSTSPRAPVPDSTPNSRNSSWMPSAPPPSPSTAGRTWRGSRPSASRPSITVPATRTSRITTRNASPSRRSSRSRTVSGPG